jgi:hypothetical protein
MISNGRVNGQYGIENDLEGSDLDLTEVLPWNLPERTKENHKNPQSR